MADRREETKGKRDRGIKRRSPKLDACGLRLLAAALVLVCAASAATIRGRVLDIDTRQPIRSVHVRVAQTVLGTVTNTQGFFELPVGSEPADVEFSHVGYEPQMLAASGGQPVLVYLKQATIAVKGLTTTAFRYPVTQDKAGPVTVIDRSAEAGRVPTDVTALLRDMPAATMRDYANFSSLALRGANNEHTLVTLDEVPLNSAQNSTFDMTTLAANLAERIEISRSGNSALYGSSSVGGSVNVLTPEPGPFGASVAGNLGSFGRRSARLLHKNRIGPVGYVVAGSLADAANDYSYQDSAGAGHKTKNADLSSLSGLAKLTFGTGAHQASVLVDANSTDRGVPGSLTWPSDSARRDDRRLLAHLGYSFEPSSAVRTDLKLYHHRFRQNYRDPLAWVPANDTHQQARTGLQLRQKYCPQDWAVLLAGVDASDERMKSTVVGNPERANVAGWLQARLERWDIGVNPILRVELVSRTKSLDSGDTRRSRVVASPRLTATWSGLEWFTLFAAVGRSFRLPSFNDLYWPEDQFTYGNPRLRPEFSTNIDFGISGKRPEFLQYWLGWYRSELVDLIQWQPDTAFRFRPVNVDSATVTGLELETRLDLRQVGLDANFNYSGATSRGEPLVYRPSLAGSARLWARQEVWILTGTLGFGAEYTAARLASLEPRIRLPSYYLLNADASVTWDLRWADVVLRFDARNLLDRSYQTAYDYPAPGRSFSAELELSH